MDSNSNIWIALACLAYAVLVLCITSITARWNKRHQWWKREDDVRKEREKD